MPNRIVLFHYLACKYNHSLHGVYTYLEGLCNLSVTSDLCE